MSARRKMSFSPHRWTVDAFRNGSSMWLLEWKNNDEFREHCWTPGTGYHVTSVKGKQWIADSCHFANGGYTEIPREMAQNILKSWKSDLKIRSEIEKGERKYGN